jgi:hypothetical protein
MEVAVLLAVFGLFTAVIVRLRRASSTRTPIATLAPGRADVHGHAAGPSQLCAPISGRTGIGFRLLIEQEQGVAGWVAVLDLAEFADFELCDRSGAIRVQASTSIISMSVGERSGMGGPFRPLPARVFELIAERVPIQGVLFQKRFRWREWVLEPDREVRVRGQVVAIPTDQTIGYRKLGHTLVLAGGTNLPLEIHD